MGLTRKYQNASLRLHTRSILGPVQKLPPHFFPLSFFFLNHSPFFPKRTLLCANCLQCSFKFINKDVLPSKEAGIYKHKMLLGFQDSLRKITSKEWKCTQEKEKKTQRNLKKIPRTNLFKHQTIKLLHPVVYHASSGYLHTIQGSCQLPAPKMWAFTFERVLLIDLSGAGRV